MLATESDRLLISKEISKAIEDEIFCGKHIIIFGCTLYAKDIRDILLDNGMRITAFIDNNRNKAGKECLGVGVYNPKDYLVPYRADVIIIICSKYRHEMTEQLKDMGYSLKNILNIPVTESQDVWGDSLNIFELGSEQVKKGFSLYKSLKIKYSPNHTFFVCSYPGTGDIYMACTYLRTYLAKKNIKNYVLLVVGNSCKRTAELFSIINIELISFNDMQNIVKAWEFLGEQRVKLKPLLYWGWRTKRYLYADKHPQITFTDMFLYDVYGEENEIKRQLPCGNKISTYADQLFEKLNLPKGRTVIIAPYAGSFESSITMEQWEKLSDLIKARGYAVCTNCYGEKEIPIPGTTAIIFPYDEAVNVLEYAGGFIAVRSGLCDIVSSAGCRMLVIYENGFNASKYEYFSLKRMGLNQNVIEKIYTTEENLLKLAEEWDEL